MHQSRRLELYQKPGQLKHWIVKSKAEDDPPRMKLSKLERLKLIANQQKRTTNKPSTIYQNMSRVQTLARVLWKIKEIRSEALEMIMEKLSFTRETQRKYIN